jgi:predicted glycosyltransferase
VASAGGGRSGYRLLASVLDACATLGDRLNFRLEAFAGPFMEQNEFDQLAARAVPGIRIQRYTRRFLDYLHAADLSISLAGYNTCMNLLVSRVPALVFPYSRQREQPMRVNKIRNFLAMKALNDDDMRPARLSHHIIQMLDQEKKIEPLPVDLNGAANSAKLLRRWVEKGSFYED